MRKILAAASAFSLAVAPIAASAGTRANDVVPAAAKIERDSATLTDASGLAGSGSTAWIIAIFVAIVAVALVVDGGDDGVSDG